MEKWLQGNDNCFTRGNEAGVLRLRLATIWAFAGEGSGHPQQEGWSQCGAIEAELDATNID